ncbi:MAG: hypothetical protein [Caudoviricetes sp.]|nr:MAG: hypothetical protein [Caudoviricetes sp.]
MIAWAYSVFGVAFALGFNLSFPDSISWKRRLVITGCVFGLMTSMYFLGGESQ